VHHSKTGALRTGMGQKRKSRLVMLRSALLPKPDMGSRIYKYNSTPRFALRCYTGFTLARLRTLDAPTGSTFVFD
jgi:hypothetical protein